MGKTNVKIEELYREYLSLLANGMTKDAALKEFSYLHAITRSRLLKRIKLVK